MSLVGNAESGYTLRGKLSGLEKINGLSAYEVAVANGFSGTEEEWLASLEGRDGADGKDGTEIASFGRTAGNGLPGTKDTYTMNMSDGRNYQFDVYNGADGTGAGDMTASVYDPDGAVASKGGISSYVDGKISAIPTPDVSGQIGTHNNDTAAHADIRAELATKTNPNLLHNWYFANPVNQRGQRVYTAQGYGPDRWMLANPFTVNCENGLTLTPNELDNRQIHQRIEHPGRLAGKKVTLSVLISSNALSNYAVFGIYANGTAVATNGIAAGRIGVFSLTTTMPDNIESAYVRLGTTTSGAPTGAITFEAVKLELGDTQTLAHQDADGNWVLNEIPDYGEELAKCQRYFLRLGSSNYGQIGMGMVHSDNILGVWLNPPTVMRIRPTPTLTGKIVAVDSTTGTPYEVQLNDGNSINKYTVPETGVVVLYLTGKTTTLTPGKVYSVQAQGGGYVDLFADL